MSHDEDDDFRPRRRRDDDFDDRPRRGRDDDDDVGRRGYDRDDAGDTVRRARSKIAAPAIVLMILGGIIAAWTVFGLATYLMNPEQNTKNTYEQYRQFMEAFTKAQQNPPNNKELPKPVEPKGPAKGAPDKGALDQDKKEPDAKDIPKKEEVKKDDPKKDDPNDVGPPAPVNPDLMTYDEFKKMYQSGAIGGNIAQLLYGLMLLIGGFKMKQLSGYGFGVFTSIIAMLPCITCCCLPTPFGLWALIVLMSQDVKDAYRLNAGRHV